MSSQRWSAPERELDSQKSPSSPNGNCHNINGGYPPPTPPAPQHGASLLLAFRGISSSLPSPSPPGPRSGLGLGLEETERTKKLALIIDRTAQTRLAASRALAALEADFRVVVLTTRAVLPSHSDSRIDDNSLSSSKPKSCPESVGHDNELRWRARLGELEIRDLSEFPYSSAYRKGDGEDEEAHALSAFLSSHSRPHSHSYNDNDTTSMTSVSTPSAVALAFITDTITTLPTSQRRSKHSAASLARVCAAHHIPLNVADMPALCDFTVCATHRALDFRDDNDDGNDGNNDNDDNDVTMPPSSRSVIVSGNINGLGNGGDTGSGERTTTQEKAKMGQRHLQRPRRATPLQIGVTTNGHGCRLGARLRRALATALPPEAGVAVEKVAQMRKIARTFTTTTGTEHAEDHGEVGDEEEGGREGEDDGEVGGEGEITPNAPVEQRAHSTTNCTTKDSESSTESVRRRMKWVAQISEYMSVKQIAALNDTDIERMLSGDVHSFPSAADNAQSHNKKMSTSTESSTDNALSQSSQHSLTLSPLPSSPKNYGCVLLVGSGPGHPSLLTLAAHHALTSLATIILADKLIPAPILALVPAHIPIHTARKFPGNSQHAQDELVSLALAHARQGKTVVRLKQGDPALFGRCGEEVRALRREGVRVLAVPGLSSALAAPLVCAWQPEVIRKERKGKEGGRQVGGEVGEGPVVVTMRGWADSVRIVTGVKRGGVMTGGQASAEGSDVPPYERGQTLIVLMANARLRAFVRALIGPEDQESESDSRSRSGVLRRHQGSYPPYLPAVIIERASLPDQRVVEAALCDIADALESTGEQRPPGLLVLGWTIAALRGRGGSGHESNNCNGNKNESDEDGDDGGDGDDSDNILSETASAGGLETIERRDHARVRRWLGGMRWRVTEGIDPMWKMFDACVGGDSNLTVDGGSKAVVV